MKIRPPETALTTEWIMDTLLEHYPRLHVQVGNRGLPEHRYWQFFPYGEPTGHPDDWTYIGGRTFREAAVAAMGLFE